MNQTSDLLTKVVERTKEGKLSWDLASESERLYETRIADLLLTMDENDPWRLMFTVSDGGVELDSISFDTDEGYWRLELKELARAARLSALGAGDKYAAALAALDDSG